MSNTIKPHQQPQPIICPLIIDYLIIPNKIVNKNNKIIENDIGNIAERLTINKIEYLYYKIKSNNITINKISNKKLNCLSSQKLPKIKKNKPCNIYD